MNERPLSALSKQETILLNQCLSVLIKQVDDHAHLGKVPSVPRLDTQELCRLRAKIEPHIGVSSSLRSLGEGPDPLYTTETALCRDEGCDQHGTSHVCVDSSEEIVTDEMVSAYLLKQRAVIEEADANHGRLPIGALSTDTVKEACREGIKAALAVSKIDLEKPEIGSDKEQSLTRSLILRSISVHPERGEEFRTEFFKFISMDFRPSVAEKLAVKTTADRWGFQSTASEGSSAVLKGGQTLDTIDLGPLKLQLRHPAKALALLQKAGILDAQGALTERFGGPGQPIQALAGAVQAAKQQLPD